MADSVVLDTPRGAVSGLVQGSDAADSLIVLAPGAGAPMTHAFMEHVADGLAGRGMRVVRFNFLYMDAGRRAPDRQPVLEETFSGVLDSLGDEISGRKLVIGGKSMGGRIASHAAAAGAASDGLLFFGYPLHPPGKPERLRDTHLYGIESPMLFVEGTRDPFCPLGTLEGVRSKLTAPNEVAVIEDGDHSFKVRKSSGRSTGEAWDEVVARSADWIEGLGAP